MSLAIPGSKGCFSFLQDTLKSGATKVHITKVVRDQLQDFLCLAKDIVRHLLILLKSFRHLQLLWVVWMHSNLAWEVCGFPQIFRYLVLFNLMPLIVSITRWRQKFPNQVQKQFISSLNPSGTITNSDLELAGSIAHDAMLAQTIPLARRSLCSFSDNTPTIAWRNKGSTTTSGPAAYLLQLAALHQRLYQYQSKLQFIPGERNCMADDCSRLSNLSDKQLIYYFNLTYPQKKS